MVGRKSEVMLSVQMRRFGCSLLMRSFDMIVTAHLGDLLVEQPQYRSLVPGRDTLFVIDNVHGDKEHLVDIEFISVYFLLAYSVFWFFPIRLLIFCVSIGE